MKMQTYQHEVGEHYQTIYTNRHTGERLRLINVERVENYPDPITVYVLDDGSRWNAEQFEAHWTAEYVELPDLPALRNIDTAGMTEAG